MIVQLNERRESAYTKRLRVIHEGQEYHVTLYWSEHEGYELDFHNSAWRIIDTPNWAIEWEDNHDESLAYYLDDESEGK